jgi:hypothetical protein
MFIYIFSSRAYASNFKTIYEYITSCFYKFSQIVTQVFIFVLIPIDKNKSIQTDYLIQLFYTFHFKIHSIQVNFLSPKS